jgi:hypothetical protein
MPSLHRALVPAALVGLLFMAASPALAQDAPVDVSGTWIFTVVTENGTGTPTVMLSQDGDRVEGTYSSPRLGTRTLEGAMYGDTLTFRLDPGEQGVPLTFAGTVQEDGSISGWVDFDGMGGATFTARRHPPMRGATEARPTRSGG